MQRPTNSLRADHVLTSRAVRVLEAIAGGVRSGWPFPSEDCAGILRFLREWMLPVHMRKEDDVVAPAVAMHADERLAGIVGELFRLGEEITELTHSLVLFWEPIGELTDVERLGFANTVDALVARLGRRHQLEEDELFPACDQHVPADDRLGWSERFAELEADRGDAASWHTRIETLAKRWLVAD
ncbi:MAG: hemerythrin domain-containing protein [Planctomycetota bacterium]